MNTMKTLAASAILGVAAFFAPSASAADVGVSVGVGVPVAPAPVYVDGGYYESVWIEPIYRTEYYGGYPRTVIVTPGYYNRVYRPYARTYVAPTYVSPSFGFGFNFSNRDHHHHSYYGHHDGYRDKPGRYR